MYNIYLKLIKFHYIIIFLYSSTIYLFSHYDLISNYYFINDDARNQLYYIPHFLDNDLFSVDLLSCGYFYSPWNLKYIYVPINYFLSMVTISKIIPYILILITCILLFKIGLILKDSLFGLFISIISITVLVGNNYFAGGNMRSFSIPIILLFVYHALTHNTKYLYLSIFISILIYPVITAFLFISLIVFLLISFFKDNNPISFLKNNSFYIILLSLSIIIIFTISIISGRTSDCFKKIPYFNVPNKLATSIINGISYYSITPYDDLMNQPEVGPAGRYNLQRYMNRSKSYIFSNLFIHDQILNTDFNSKFYNNILKLLLIIFLVFILIKNKKAFTAPSVLNYVFISSLLMFFLIYFLYPYISYNLYLANKQLIYTIPIFLLMTVSLNIYNLKINFFKYSIMSILTIFILIYFFISFTPKYQYCKDINIYKFIETLPKDAVVAGNPIQMDCIPIYTKRSILVGWEWSQPVRKKLWEIIKERTYDIFNAYYSHNANEFLYFCNKYPNSYFVVDNYYFSKDYFSKDPIYMAPFDDHIRQLTKDNNFFLKNLDSKYKIFELSNTYMIKCNEFINNFSSSPSSSNSIIPPH